MPPKLKSSYPSSRHVGTVQWIYKAGDEDCGEVTEALFRSAHEIAIDCRCNDYSYTMVLKSGDGIKFTGVCRGRCNGETWQPTIMFELWANQSGFLLFGEWVEDGAEAYCAIQLHPK